MTSFFFGNAGEIIFIDHLDKTKTINGEFRENLLKRLSEEIKHKREHLAKKKSLFHQSNELAEKSVTSMATIKELKFELLSYAPDFGHSGYVLLPNLKIWLTGQTSDVSS